MKRIELMRRARLAEYLVHGLDGPVVVVDARVCALLNRLALDKLRPQLRSQDPQLYQTLVAIRLAGLSYESSTAGTCVAPQPEPAARLQPQLNDTVSTTTAADLLNITDRAVRKAIAEKRLPATRVDGRYRITREDLTNYKATRAP